MIDHAKLSTIVVSAVSVIIAGIANYAIQNPQSITDIFTALGVGGQVAAGVTLVIVSILSAVYNVKNPGNSTSGVDESNVLGP